ncbi:hypothetical protein SOV_51060 [Sporomusa ovata DSM 2662]|nr:hypothetical protein [Sporomusa ovata]EQB27479.1 A2L zinc ribbon domain containing protein [Sporomusa ovata DSM 2662]
MNKSCGNCIYWSANHAEHKKCKDCMDLRNNFVPRDMLCPVPSCQSSMIYYKKDAYLCCPDCGTEIWPFNSEQSDSKSIREEFEKQLPCDRNSDTTHGTLVTVHSKLNGGSKSKGSKKPAKKKSTTQINNELAASGNKIKLRKIENS